MALGATWLFGSVAGRGTSTEVAARPLDRLGELRSGRMAEDPELTDEDPEPAVDDDVWASAGPTARPATRHPT